MYQRNFLAAHVTRKSKRTETAGSRKVNSLEYSLQSSGVEVRVCKKFFLHTLDISGQMIETVFKKMASNGIISSEKRKFPSSRKLSDAAKQSIQQHIALFPTMPSHYCRKNNTKEYLAEDLNLSEMYRLYIQYCRENTLVPAKQWAYNGTKMERKS